MTSLFVAGACTRTAEPPGGAASGRDSALATLTAAAGSVDANGPSGAAAASGAKETAVGQAGSASGQSPESSMTEEAYVATKRAADATAGIADVSDLVQSMPPLATFTPGADEVSSKDSLTYVRGTDFHRADAAAREVEDVDMGSSVPPVWAPPDDPGRAWETADGKRMVFFAGPDAELWMADADGSSAARASEPNLPTDIHTVSVSGRDEDVRLRPGVDYTLVCLEGADPLAVFVDDNSRHVKGQTRLRVIHAAQLHHDTTLDARVAGVTVGRPMAFAESSGDASVASGEIQIELLDAKGRSVANLPAFAAADKELKTVFLYGTDDLNAFETTYQPGTPSSGDARVRVFNATGKPVDVTLDQSKLLATGLASGAIGEYVSVASTMPVDAREDARILIYGLRGGEEPVAWNQAGDRVAFVGAGDGWIDLYVAAYKGGTARVTEDAETDLNPRWSPDGGSLVWEAVDEAFDQHSLRVWRGGAVSTIDISPIRTALDWPPSSNVQFPGGVDWVDDSTIYLYPKSAQGAGGLWLMDVIGGEARQLFTGAVDEVAFSREAGAWALAPGGRAGELITLGLDGTERTIAKGQAHAPLWSPDARMISWVEGDKTSPEGWRIHVVQADGSNDRVLTDWLPLLQTSPPVPGPNAKRWWLSSGDRLAFTRAGRDYGAAERAGAFGKAAAGDDIENLWIVATDGKSAPNQATDLTKVFYLTRLLESPTGDALGLVGFSYRDRAQQLWTIPAAGGAPTQIDGAVRWYMWLR